jgi:hypothetical protein
MANPLRQRKPLANSLGAYLNAIYTLLNFLTGGALHGAVWPFLARLHRTARSGE